MNGLILIWWHASQWVSWHQFPPTKQLAAAPSCVQCWKWWTSSSSCTSCPPDFGDDETLLSQSLHTVWLYSGTQWKNKSADACLITQEMTSYFPPFHPHRPWPSVGVSCPPPSKHLSSCHIWPQSKVAPSSPQRISSKFLQYGRPLWTLLCSRVWSVCSLYALHKGEDSKWYDTTLSTDGIYWHTETIPGG